MSYGKDIPDKRLAELARAGDRCAWGVAAHTRS